MKSTRYVAAACVALSVTAACGDEEGARFPPVDHAATKKECTSCHLMFPPEMLPARSWQKLMADLSNHFGEDASLDQATRDEIEKYLVSRAADAPSTADGPDPWPTPRADGDRRPAWHRPHLPQ